MCDTFSLSWLVLKYGEEGDEEKQAGVFFLPCRHPSNLRELEQFAHKQEAKVPVDRCRSLIESYRNRLIASKGWATKYYVKCTVIFLLVSLFHDFVFLQLFC